MYEKFYGLKRKPFQLLPDADFLFRSKKHDIALTCLEYGIFERAGFILITGEIGTGKTTLINYLIRTIEKELPICYISQTYLNPEEFLRILCQEFSLPHEGKGKSELIELFGKFLVDRFRKGQYVILILDEAQNLPFATLEEIRMLSNLDAGSENILQIILVGQPALRQKLRRPEMRQLAQRVEVSYHLEPLDREETSSYIRYRIEKAGGNDIDLFEEEAIHEVYNYSRGIPRLINSICHMCLVYGMADEKKRIDRSIVMNVLNDRSQWDLLPQEEGDGGDGEGPHHVASSPQEEINLGEIFRNLSLWFSTISEMAGSFKGALEEFKEKITIIPVNDRGEGEKRATDIPEDHWQTLIDRLNSIEKAIVRGIDSQQRLIRIISSRLDKKEWKKKIAIITGSTAIGMIISYLFFSS